MAGSNDARQVALLKSLETQNRFYVLIDPALGWKNADTIPAFPDDVPLGIAYPCLEDGLNDFAVIRTTFETLDLFPEDRELREELMGIIQEARGNLVRRLQELRDRIGSGQALFLGTDLQEFKETVVGMATKGALRKQLDQMMKLEVFESVAAFEADRDLQPPVPTYLYRLGSERSWEDLTTEEPRAFVAACFDDLLAAVQDDVHYEGKYPFDCHIFQKFIAVMFVNYATTDAAFYGTAKGDYGVSADREMQETPLYRAIAEALRDREQTWKVGTRRHGPETGEGLSPNVPAADQGVIVPLTALANALLMLRAVDHPRVGEASQVISRACDELFACLRTLNVVAPMTEDPFSQVLDAQQPARAGRPTSMRILVAEDNPVNQGLLRRMLEKRGYTVVVAGTGREAVAAIERESFDLVLMDVQMPEMGGFEATLAIRARERRTGKRTSIIAVTAYAMQGFRDKCLGVGMDDYVSKPVHQREIFAAIERRLASDAASPDTSADWIGNGLLDRAAVLDRVDGDTDLLQDLIAQFLADYPRQLAGLRDRIARHDTRGVELAAHGLRGAIDNFSAQEASAAALRLEMIARDGDLTRAGEAYTALEQALQRLQPALASLGQAGV